jgi:hypothetical protein
MIPSRVLPFSSIYTVFVPEAIIVEDDIEFGCPKWQVLYNTSHSSFLYYGARSVMASHAYEIKGLLQCDYPIVRNLFVCKEI